MWIALSRRWNLNPMIDNCLLSGSCRWFMGKDTAIRPIRLDSHELLLECARFAGELATSHCDSILVLSWISVCTCAQCQRVLQVSIWRKLLVCLKESSSQKSRFTERSRRCMRLGYIPSLSWCSMWKEWHRWQHDESTAH